MSDIDEVLKSRAKKLSGKIEGRDLVQETFHLLSFRLGKEIYAAEMKFAVAVYAYHNVITLPGLPSFVLGVMNIRQQIFSILDLHQLLSLGQNAGDRKTDKVILIKDGDLEFGVCVDEVYGEKLIEKSYMKSIPTAFHKAQKELLIGVTPDNAIVLDFGVLCKKKELIVNQLSD